MEKRRTRGGEGRKTLRVVAFYSPPLDTPSIGASPPLLLPTIISDRCLRSAAIEEQTPSAEENGVRGGV